MSNEYVGFVVNPYNKAKFFNITCPCGVTASYPLYSFPDKDTPHPCGNPNHWVVKYIHKEEK